MGFVESVSYTVPAVHCAHCEAAIAREVRAVPGVETVHVDLVRKLVTITGKGLDDGKLRAAIDEAGFDVA